jgi:hypothetical protein
MKNYAILCLMYLSVPSTAVAQEAAPLILPDPSTITVPDIAPSSDPKVAKQGHKFFYFNNPDVTFEQAYEDFTECRRHLAKGAVIATPAFVPWVEPSVRKAKGERANTGLVGAFVGSILINHLERGMRANKMRMCMEPRGYKRYAIKEASWQTLNEGDEAQILLMHAKIGSAPKPSSGEVAE